MDPATVGASIGQRGDSLSGTWEATVVMGLPTCDGIIAGHGDGGSRMRVSPARPARATF